MQEMPSFGGEAKNREQAPENSIQAAGSLEELKEALLELGEIEGSKGKKYSADELIEEINKLKQSVAAGLNLDSQAASMLIRNITRAGDLGLRDKVAELLKTESQNE